MGNVATASLTNSRIRIEACRAFKSSPIQMAASVVMASSIKTALLSFLVLSFDWTFSSRFSVVAWIHSNTSGRQRLRPAGFLTTQQRIALMAICVTALSSRMLSLRLANANTNHKAPRSCCTTKVFLVSSNPKTNLTIVVNNVMVCLVVVADCDMDNVDDGDALLLLSVSSVWASLVSLS